MAKKDDDSAERLAADLKAAGARRFSIEDEEAEIVRQLSLAEEEFKDPAVKRQDIEKKRLDLIFLRLSGDLAHLAAQPQFRRFCWKVFELTKLFAISQVQGDPYGTAHNEGRRAVGLDLLALLMKIDPGLFLQIQREHISDIKAQGAKNGGA